MRFFLALFAIGLVSCGPRYIDHSAGLGPQGGPGYKPSAPPDNDVFRTYVSSLLPLHASSPDFKWAFKVTRGSGAAVSEDEYFALNDGNIYSSYSGSFVFGYAKCLEPKAIDNCSTVEFKMAADMFRTGGTIDMSRVVRWTEHEDPNCEISGRFEGESERVWARGPMTTFELLESPGSPYEIFVPNAEADLETLPDLSPTNVPATSLYAVSNESSLTAVINFRVPTQLKNGVVISLPNYPTDIRLRSDGHGHFKGVIEFTRADSGRNVEATVDFSCH